MGFLSALMLVALVPSQAGDAGQPMPFELAGAAQRGPGLAIDDAALAHHLVRPNPSEPSKKARELAEKARRPNIHLDDTTLARSLREQARRVRMRTGDLEQAETAPPVPGMRVEPWVTLFNTKTREAMALLPGHATPPRFDALLRDHFTNQATEMDAQLLQALVRAARHFDSPRIDIVSGYRSPKYNLMLRKKGRQVAAESQHCLGRAVDFRVQGVTTAELLRFVRGLRMGGVGFYPHSGFVHCDTGPVRFWKGG